MREFSIYIETDECGLVGNNQKEQLQLMLDCLKNRCVNLVWLINGERISQRQVINVFRCEHFLCKGKKYILHNAFCIEGKKVSSPARWLMKKLLVELYEDKRIQAKDYSCLFYGNEPEGCFFSSCLGNTAYLQKNGNISICPYGEEIRLNSLKAGDMYTDLYETEGFKALLIKQIQRRNTCKANCKKYDLCHGGCPLTNDGQDPCRIMKSVMKQGEKVSEEDEFDQRISHLAAMYRG